MSSSDVPDSAGLDLAPIRKETAGKMCTIIVERLT
jgi:hypothetical protein